MVAVESLAEGLIEFASQSGSGPGAFKEARM